MSVFGHTSDLRIRVECAVVMSSVRFPLKQRYQSVSVNKRLRAFCEVGADVLCYTEELRNLERFVFSDLYTYLRERRRIILIMQ